MKKVAIYSRKSKETDTGESIKTQIQMCRDYFERKNDTYTFEIFQDEGFSGGNTNRPEFQRMMMLAEKRAFDIVACYKIDRIGRNIIDFMNTFDELEKHDIDLVSITEGFDPATPAGKMMMTMIAGFAEMERMNISQRVKDNMSALAKLGRWSGGTPPTGYRSVRVPNGNKTAMYLELIPEWKEKLQAIFKAVSDNATIRQAATLLNMPPKTISNIISNPVYCRSDEESSRYLESIGYTVLGELNGYGYLAYNRRPRSKTGKKMFNPCGMFAAVSIHEAPVSSSLWISANENVKKRGYESRPRTSHFSFLAHKVKCTCGCRMYVYQGRMRKDGTQTCYFRCTKHHSDKTSSNAKWINAHYLESDIMEMLKNITYDKSVLQSYIDIKPEDDLKLQIDLMKNSISKNTKKIDSLTEKLILLEGSAALAAADKMNALSKENDNLKCRLLSLEREALFHDQNNLNVEILHGNILKLLQNFSNLSMEEKQLEIGSIISEIQLNIDGSFNIKFNI